MGLQQIPSKGGIPSGNTAGRPGSPVIGDTYYNGQLELLEIYNGTQWVAASAPPAVPVISSVTDVGNVAYASGGSLSVAVAAPTAGGTPSQYNAQTTSGGFTGSSSTSPVVISGLVVGSSYSVVVNGQNNFGVTTNSLASDAVTVTTLPQIPTIGTATASSTANEITVTWTNGATGGKALSSITITPFLNGTTAETARTAATTSSTSYTFTEGQLTAGASYTFKVKATNANGTCADSTASNSATMPNFIPIDVLVVAGGGGNGSDGGGAGGGGGVGRNTSYGVLLSTNYTVTVGAGGAGFSSSPGAGANGGNSVFGTMTAYGGGGGGGNTSNNAIAKGQNGGCGGGSQGNTNQTAQGAQPGGTATQGAGGNATYYGYNGTRSGDNGGTTLTEGGGSGGGAGGLGGNNVGASATSTQGGVGGPGYLYSPNSTRYAGGGGGGGGSSSSSIGLGQDGGGDGGKGSFPSTAGATNRGGGAGANSGYGSTSNSGGSGIVIVRYPDTYTLTVGAGLTASTSSASGTKTTTFTAGTGNVSLS